MRMLVASLLMFVLVACEEAPDVGTETAFSGGTMGTTFTVKVVDLPEKLGAVEVQAQISAILKDVNDKMSLWVPDSELVRFNKSNSTEWQTVSEDLYKVTAAAQGISEMTAGQFDVTLEPLIKIWGFSTKDKTNEPPAETEIAQAMEKVGYQKVSLQAQPLAMKKAHPELTVNLSAIAKGFGIDQLADYLESQGVANYMVEIGGDLRVKGTNAARQPWRIAIEKPDVTSRSVHRVIAVQGAGMATSGDYRNYFEKDGQRYTHIINPTTGRPVMHKLASVTVLSDSAMMADGLATALLVMGHEDGPALAEKHGIAAFFLIRDGEGFVEKKSSHFATYEKKH